MTKGALVTKALRAVDKSRHIDNTRSEAIDIFLLLMLPFKLFYPQMRRQICKAGHKFKNCRVRKWLS